MKLAILHRRAPRAAYFWCVDYLLARRYGTSIARQNADEIVRAARMAGHSPRECAAILAELDGLERS